jgi:hypothetical protein
MQEAGYQVANLTQANADAVLVSCSSTCTQYDWGGHNQYDNIPRSPTEWIQLSLSTTIYGFATSVELTDSDRAGLAFANGDPRNGKSVVTIATLSDGGTYNGFYGFATGQPVMNLYIGYPLRAGAAMPGSQGDTFSMDGIFVAITPREVSTPETASFRALSLGLSFLAVVAVIARRRVPFHRLAPGAHR